MAEDPVPRQSSQLEELDVIAGHQALPGEQGKNPAVSHRGAIGVMVHGTHGHEFKICP